MVFEKCDGSGSIRLGLCGPDQRICVFFSVWVIWACDLWDLAELGGLGSIGWWVCDLLEMESDPLEGARQIGPYLLVF